MSLLLACAGMTNSPALIGVDPPKTLARVRKASADRTAPACFNSTAASDRVAPSGTVMLTSLAAGPSSLQPATKRNAMNAATARPISRMPQPMRRVGLGRDRLAMGFSPSRT